MPKIINYTLNESEKSIIKEAIKNHADLRVRQRAQIIRLLHKGYKPKEVAELLGIAPSQVAWWHQRWRSEGVAGLADKPRSGRPSKADEAYRAKLEEVMNTEPSQLGYAFQVWDAPRLKAHLAQETGVQMSQRTFLNLLAQEEYVYRRPKHDLSHLQDKEAKEAAAETIDMLKKKPKMKKSNFSLWMKQP